MNELSVKQKRALKRILNQKGVNASDKATLSELLSDKIKKIKLFVDGASDLNSKTAGIGGAIYIDSKEVSNFSEPLIDKTNNESEYLALIKGIKLLIKLNLLDAEIFSDSELIVKQVIGDYKIKNSRMKKLNASVKSELRKMKRWKITHIRREKNVRADQLSKDGLNTARNL